MPDGRVHHHTLRLVDDDQVLVLEDDIQRDILGRDRHRLRFGDIQRDNSAGKRLPGRLQAFSVQRRPPFGQQFLDKGTRLARQQVSQTAVQPLAGFSYPDVLEHAVPPFFPFRSRIDRV